VAVPGHSYVRTATSFRQSAADLLCHIAAPGDGRTPTDRGELLRLKSVLGKEINREIRQKHEQDFSRGLYISRLNFDSKLKGLSLRHFYTN
jgi:hypothetical protein